MLKCEECGARATTPEQARHWRAYLSRLERNGSEDAKVVVVYCPRCAEREFGNSC